MTLLKENNKYVVSVSVLHKLTLRKNICKELITSKEELVIKHSMEYWSVKVDITEEDKRELWLITQCSIADENGELDLKQA